MSHYVPTYFDNRTMRRRHLEVCYSMSRWMNDTAGRFLLLETEQYFAIVTQEETGYLVSILKEPKQHKDSYIEVEGVGEAYETALYKVILTKEENDRLQEV